MSCPRLFRKAVSELPAVFVRCLPILLISLLDFPPFLSHYQKILILWLSKLYFLFYLVILN